VHALQTKTLANQISKATIRYLEKQSPQDAQKLANEEHYRAQLNAPDSQAANWASSNSYRDIFRRQVKKLNEAGAPPLSLQEFKKLVRGQYFAMPVNMRIHEVVGSSQLTPQGALNYLMRVGVMSDMSNGYTNLAQLKEIVAALEHPDLKIKAKGLEKLHTLRAEIHTIRQHELKQGKRHIAAGCEFALKQLGEGKADDQVLARLKKTVDARKTILQKQFLPMLMQHLEKGHIPADGPLKMLDVRLLNHNSKSVDPTGWYHNEENEMLDMAAIFKEFDGKDIVFGDDGPCIDNEGNICLPKKFYDELAKNPEFDKRNPKGGNLQLRALCVNQSVQGYTHNDGSTRQLNHAALDSLQDFLHPAEAAQMKKILQQPKTSFKSAVEMIELARLSGCRVSTGCLSGKDRTGQVCAAWSTFKMMKLEGFSESKLKLIMKLQQTGKSIAGQVIRENTPPMDKMKLTTFKQDWGVGTGAAGVLIRAPIYLMQGIGILSQRADIANELGYTLKQKLTYVISGDNHVNYLPKRTS